MGNANLVLPRGLLLSFNTVCKIITQKDPWWSEIHRPLMLNAVFLVNIRLY